ncbi:MAG: nucleotidyltransferase domain-containing protein [Anaerolineae bacterium]
MNKRSQALLRQARAKMAELAQHPVLSAHWADLSLVLKGSTSRGNADRYSDIDLVFYAPGPVKQAVVEDYYARGLTDRRDGIFIFFPNGHYHIEPLEALAAYFSAPDYIRCWEVEHALALHDPGGQFAAVVAAGKGQLFTYPLEVVKRAYLDLQLDLDWMRMPLIRADAAGAFLHMATITRSLCRMAYLLDQQPYPPDKWAAHYLGTTRWGRANGRALQAYIGASGAVNRLVLHQPFESNPLYLDAQRLINAVGRVIARDYGCQPWLERWYDYV